MNDKIETLENAIRHINTAIDVDPWAKQTAVEAMRYMIASLVSKPKQVRGRWIEFSNHMAYKCSECGRIIQTTDGRRNVSKHYPFCHCGADMREG